MYVNFVKGMTVVVIIMMLCGIVFPILISTNQLPLTIMLVSVTLIVLLVVRAFMWLFSLE